MGPQATLHRRRSAENVALLLVAGGFVLLAYRKFASELRFEDALIVLRYARNIVNGEGMVFNPGERVLGVSTPLFTLLSTLFVTGDVARAPDLQNLFGIVSLAVEAVLAGFLTRRFGYPSLALPVQLLVLSNFGHNYLYFGMEVHLYAALVFATYLLLLKDREWALGVVLGLAFLVRYDAALLALLVGVTQWVRNRRPPLGMTVIFAVVVLPWIVFAWGYFGTILPEPLRAKSAQIGFIDYLLRVGSASFETLGRFITTYIPAGRHVLGAAVCAALIAFGALRLVRRDARASTILAYPAVQVLVYAAIGSDPNFTWHTYIVTPVMWLLLVVGTSEALAAVAHRAAMGTVARAVPVVLLIVSLPVASRLYTGMQRRYTLDQSAAELWRIAEWIDRRYPDTTSLMNPSIGILGWVTNLRIVDQAGLVSPGLRYHGYRDNRERSSLRSAADRYRPDLVLLLEPEDEVLLNLGYERVTSFDASSRYRLYARSRPR